MMLGLAGLAIAAAAAVASAAPVAVATVNATSHATLVPFSFDSSGSTGGVVSVLWIFDDGTVSTDAAPTHQYADGAESPGQAYTVTLIVTDGAGAQSTDSVTVDVVNRAPVADAPDVSGNTVTALAFSGAGSYDLDGRIVNATWSFSDGITLYGLTVIRSFDDDGAYTCTLTVKDEDGAQDGDPCAITIDNQGPVAVVSTSPVMPFQPGVAAQFDGRNSYDVDGVITNYIWVFPGGVEVYASTASHTFASNGTYNVTLVLVDDDGAIGQLTIAALVGNDTLGTRVPTPPIGRITASALTVLTGVPITLSGENSTDDTGILSYLWDFGDSTSGVGVLVAHAWANDGNYIVSLNVTDTDGNSSFVTVTIHVVDRAPVASILASPTNAQTLVAISFDAGSSSDSDGTILFYRWSFGDATVLYGRSVQHTYARAGGYTVTLTVTDNDGVDGTATASVTITNRAPTAVVPANFSVPTYEEHIFDASGSFDLDGVVQTYTWDFGDSTSATGRQAKHAFTSTGPFTVTLTVRDDLGASGQKTMSVTVTNQAPTASIAGPMTISTSDTANFVGTAVDRDGTIASWSWTFGEGSPSSTPNAVSHQYVTKGTYTVTLNVVDNNGASGSASFVITVLNRIPTARIASASPAGTQVSLSAVQFQAGGTGGSSDPETAANLLDYFWIFGDGGVASGVSVAHAFSQAGTFTVILTVSDPDGGAASVTMPYVITNQAPASHPAANVSSALTLESVHFEGAGSVDPDGFVQSFLWDFGDGLTSSAVSPDHVYQAAPLDAGAYTVRLTVFDNLGASNAATMQITVTNRAPVGVIENGEPLYASLTAFFRATASSDADGIVATYQWSFGDGSETQTGSEVSHVFGSAGTFNVTLTVTDNRGGTSTVSKEVTVQAKPTFNPPNGGTTQPQAQPGFESAAALAAVAMAGALALASRRRRQA